MSTGGTRSRVLGVDPGLSRCGYGCIEQTPEGPRAVSAGVLRTSPALAVPDRLVVLADDLDGLLVDLAPAAVAVERVLFQVNVRTAMAVGQASGLALHAAARRGLAVTEYSPNEVKQAVAGDGGADKAQIQWMVRSLLRLAEPPRPADVADALALALCHLSSAPLRERAGSAPTERAPGLSRAIESALGRDGRS